MSIAQWQLKLDHIVNVGGASSTNKGGRLTSLPVIPLFQEQRIQSLVLMVRTSFACS